MSPITALPIRYGNYAALSFALVDTSFGPGSRPNLTVLFDAARMAQVKAAPSVFATSSAFTISFK